MNLGPFAWNASQRRALLLLLTALLVFLSFRYACNPTYVSDPQPEVPPRHGELADRIDPNTATWADLAALPAVGERRAKDIVAHRESYLAAHPGGTAFARPEDLLRIKGIGAAMLMTLEPYLLFPANPGPTTRPAPGDPSAPSR